MVSVHLGKAQVHSTTFLRNVPSVAFETAFTPVIKSALGHRGLVEVICFKQLCFDLRGVLMVFVLNVQAHPVHPWGH